jgi:hypothetical protein
MLGRRWRGSKARGKNSPKGKPRARLLLGVSTSACQAQYHYQEAQSRSQGYLRSPPVGDSSSDSPYQAKGNCGPGGIRTRTFELDRQMCCQLHHGPRDQIRGRGTCQTTLNVAYFHVRSVSEPADVHMRGLPCRFRGRWTCLRLENVRRNSKSVRSSPGRTSVTNRDRHLSFVVQFNALY